jgi:hypothetical protein
MTACLDGIGKTMEQRRIDAGIELHTANAGAHRAAKPYRRTAWLGPERKHENKLDERKRKKLDVA